MKTSLLTLALVFGIGTANAQFTQNFEGTEAGLSGSCWSLTNVYRTGDPAEVITGTGSLFTNPPTNESGTRDLVTPALNVTDVNLQVSFNYKMSTPLNGNATRSIEIGVRDVNNVYTTLATITLNRFSPAGVQQYSNSFVLASTGLKKLVFKFGGSTGDGNSRLIFDDLFVNASARYANGCNDAPVAVNDAFSAMAGTVITGNILDNDNEPNGEPMSPKTVSVSALGTLVLNANGTFVFTPTSLFTGNTTFTYHLEDNGFAPMTSNVATVTLTYFAPTSLPVTLVFFNAMLGNNNRVNLSWVTATEENVSHFVVEKSVNGQEFNDAGIVFATGNSTEKVSYAFADNIGNAQDRVLYYRLRSVDVDGKTQLSETRIIRLTKDAGPAISILAYPNPVTTDLRVTIPANWQNRKVVYEVYGLNGALALKKENGSASQTESLNVSNVAPGVYMIRVSCDGVTAQQKIVKH